MARTAGPKHAAMEALKSYAIATGSLNKDGTLAGDPECAATALSDLLADLMHVADDLDVEFEYELGRATEYYNEEV